jgi:hypothetical protein
MNERVGLRGNFGLNLLGKVVHKRSEGFFVLFFEEDAFDFSFAVLNTKEDGAALGVEKGDDGFEQFPDILFLTNGHIVLFVFNIESFHY